MDNYLEHHGVKGMKWGVRKAPAVNKRPINRAKKPKNKPLSDTTKAKIKKGAKIAAAVLGVAGGITISALLIKNAHSNGQRAGMLQAQKEMRMFRRAAAAKGAVTRAENKAKRAAMAEKLSKAAKIAAESTLSTMGHLNVQDFISMVR